MFCINEWWHKWTCLWSSSWASVSAFKNFGKCFKENWLHFLYSHLPPKFLCDTCYSFVWDATWDNVIKPPEVCVAVEANPVSGDMATLQTCGPIFLGYLSCGNEIFSSTVLLKKYLGRKTFITYLNIFQDLRNVKNFSKKYL